MIAPVTVLGLADLPMHLESAGVALPAGFGWRLGLAALLVLISAVAGRIVPSFTRKWLAKRGASPQSGAHGLIDSAALGFLHARLFGRVFLPAFQPVGVLLIFGAAAPRRAALFSNGFRIPAASAA